MAEVVIKTVYRKTSIPKATIKKAARIAYATHPAVLKKINAIKSFASAPKSA